MQHGVADENIVYLSEKPAQDPARIRDRSTRENVQKAFADIAGRARPDDEVFVVLSVWNFSKVLAVLSAAVVILTAGYILWAVQRVYLGPEYKGPHGDHLHDMTLREKCIIAPLLVCTVLFGVFPQAAFSYMSPSVNQSVRQLMDWKQAYDVRAKTTGQASGTQPTTTAAATSVSRPSTCCTSTAATGS